MKINGKIEKNNNKQMTNCQYFDNICDTEGRLIFIIFLNDNCFEIANKV